MYDVKIKRVYAEITKDDGYRILVDRLWPRGIKKEIIKIDYWAKEIAPSNELRKTFNHSAEEMDEFRLKYNIELDNNVHTAEFINLVTEKLKEQNVTLLYAAKNEENNQAVVLRDRINKYRKNTPEVYV